MVVVVVVGVVVDFAVVGSVGRAWLQQFPPQSRGRRSR